MEHLKLSQEQIDKLEEFIRTNQPRTSENILANITIRDIDNGIELYRQLKSGAIEKNYIKFGENGWGFTVYALYKSISNKIYVIQVSMQTPTCYAIIENENEFYPFSIVYNESFNV
jgi:hypothetical protein